MPKHLALSKVGMQVADFVQTANSQGLVQVLARNTTRKTKKIKVNKTIGRAEELNCEVPQLGDCKDQEGLTHDANSGYLGQRSCNEVATEIDEPS